VSVSTGTRFACALIVMGAASMRFSSRRPSIFWISTSDLRFLILDVRDDVAEDIGDAPRDNRRGYRLHGGDEELPDAERFVQRASAITAMIAAIRVRDDST